MEKIGTITKPQGLKGEFRAKIEGISKDNLKSLKNLIINKESYKIKKLVFRDGFVIFEVEGIADCNQAEILRNTPIFAEVDRELKEDEVLISDIIGFKVVLDSDEVVGELISIEDYGASEIYVVKGNSSEVMFPNARKVIKDFDMANIQIILNADIFREIRIDN